MLATTENIDELTTPGTRIFTYDLTSTQKLSGTLPPLLGTGGGMELRVDRIANRTRQVWFTNGAGWYYERYINTSSASPTWSPWYKFAGTEITT